MSNTQPGFATSYQSGQQNNFTSVQNSGSTVQSITDLLSGDITAQHQILDGVEESENNVSTESSFYLEDYTSFGWNNNKF